MRRKSLQRKMKKVIFLTLALFFIFQAIPSLSGSVFASPAATRVPNIPVAGQTILDQIETMTFNHDGMLVSFDELDVIKAKIAAQEEPWYSNYLKMKGSAQASLSYTPTPYEYPSADINGSNDQGNAAETSDASAAYTQALMWYFTNDTRYAEKAIEILNAWGSTLKAHKGGNWYLNAAWAASVFPLGAEIIRYSYTGWSEADINQFSTMLSTAYLPDLNNRLSYGNRELSVINGLVAIGVFNNDRAAFYQGVNNWIDYVPTYFYIDADNQNPIRPNYFNNKPTIEDYLAMQADIYPNPADSWLNISNNRFSLGEDRGIPTQTLEGAFYNPGTFIDGICGETGRDLAHAEMSFAAAINTAEIAKNQGFDLYGLYAQRFVSFSEQNSAFRLGQPVPSTLYGGVINPIGMGATYEISYDHFHNVLGYDMPRTKQLITTAVRKLRATYYNPPKGFFSTRFGGQTGLVANWETLTHGKPIPAATPDMNPPALTGVSIKAGSTMGTTTFDTLPAGNYYYVKGAANEVAMPSLGDIATLFAYQAIAGENISVKAGEHIYVVSVDDQRNVLGYSDLEITASTIRQWPDDTKTLTPIADYYSRSSNQTQSTGTWNALDIAGGNIGYLKFDISGVTSASKSVFSLYCTELNDKGDGYMQIYGVDDTTWDEATATYLTAPVITTGALTTLRCDEINKYFEFDISAYIQSQIKLGKTAITLAVKNASTLGTYPKFNSREAGANRPQLIVAPATDTIMPAYELSGMVWAKGTAHSTTMATYIPDGYGTIKYIVGEAGEIAQPNVGDSAENYVRILTANTNIRVVSGQHLYMVSVDDNNRIVSWADMPVSDANIMMIIVETKNFITTQDTYCSSARTSPTGTWVNVDCSANSPVLIKFNVTGIPVVGQAKIGIYVKTGYYRTTGNRTFYAYGCDDTTWTEAATMYSNMPPLYSTPITSITIGEPTTVSGTKTFNAYYEFDVTDYVAAKIAAGQNVITIAIKGDATNDSISCDSREGSNKPYLTVTSKAAQAVAITGVSVNKETASIEVGQSVRITEIIEPEAATDQRVTWTSSDNSVATVDDRGLVTGISAGVATITVKTTDGEKTAESIVTVSEEAPQIISVSRVTLDKESDSIAIGSTTELLATVLPEDAQNMLVTWSSSAPEIADVDSNGVVTAYSAGEAIITVTTADGNKQATCVITVLADSDPLELAKADLQSLISTAEQTVQGKLYTETTFAYFTDKLNLAKAAMSNEDYTAIDFQQCKEGLQGAMNALIEVPDTASYEALLTQLNTMLADKIYTASSFAYAQGKRDSAIHFATQNPTVERVNHAIFMLGNAMNALVELPNFAEYEAKLTELSAKLDDTSITYTSPSVAYARGKLASAVYYATEYQTVDRVNYAILLLTNATNALVELPNFAEYEAKLTELNAMLADGSDYTDGSVNYATKKRGSAEYYATQYQTADRVSYAITILDNAIVSLKLK